MKLIALTAVTLLMVVAACAGPNDPNRKPFEGYGAGLNASRVSGK